MHKNQICTLCCMIFLSLNCSEKGSKKPRKLERDDSRWAVNIEEQRNYVVNSKNYRKSSRVPKKKSEKVQDLDNNRHLQVPDMPPHLRSCSCCPEPVPIEGVPDRPWYVRWFAFCCSGGR